MFTTSKKQRPLTDQDRLWSLPIDRRSAEPHASGRVIAMNSTYLELVDGIFANRGMMSSVGVFGVVLSTFVVFSLLYTVVTHYLNPSWDRHDESEMLSSTIFVAVVFLFLASFEFVVGGFGGSRAGVSPAQRTLEARSPSKMSHG